MRTISSLRFVALLAPPMKGASPLTWSTLPLGVGKMPAPSNAVAFGWIMQDGIMLPGNCAPRVTPGFAPPGQFANRTESATLDSVGTIIGVVTELKSPL